MTNRTRTAPSSEPPRHEQAAGILRTLIAEMRLRPGERLVERELVELVGVSRSSVREAIRQLAAEGLITTTPNRGAVVSIPTPREAAELYEIRAVLEGLATELFVQRARQDQIVELRRAYDRLEVETREPIDSARLLEAKNQFYETLLAGADNGTMVTLLMPLQTRISALRATSMAQPGRSKAALDEIREVVEAVEARDAKAASAACVKHIYAASRAALEALAVMTSSAVIGKDGSSTHENQQERPGQREIGDGSER